MKTNHQLSLISIVWSLIGMCEYCRFSSALFLFLSCRSVRGSNNNWWAQPRGNICCCRYRILLLDSRLCLNRYRSCIWCGLLRYYRCCGWSNKWCYVSVLGYSIQSILIVVGYCWRSVHHWCGSNNRLLLYHWWCGDHWSFSRYLDNLLLMLEYSRSIKHLLWNDNIEDLIQHRSIVNHGSSEQ